MSSTDKLQETLAKYLAETMLALVLSVLAAIAVFAVDWLLPTELIESLGNRAIAQIMLVLFLVVLALIALIVYLRYPRLIFIPNIGIYVHKKTGIYYCVKCKLNKRINSPMRIYEENEGWRCSACGSFIKNPEYKEPPPKPRSGGSTDWMRY